MICQSQRVKPIGADVRSALLCDGNSMCLGAYNQLIPLERLGNNRANESRAELVRAMPSAAD